MLYLVEHHEEARRGVPLNQGFMVVVPVRTMFSGRMTLLTDSTCLPVVGRLVRKSLWEIPRNRMDSSADFAPSKPKVPTQKPSALRNELICVGLHLPSAERRRMQRQWTRSQGWQG